MNNLENGNWVIVFIIEKTDYKNVHIKDNVKKNLTSRPSDFKKTRCATPLQYVIQVNLKIILYTIRKLI